MKKDTFALESEEKCPACLLGGYLCPDCKPLPPYHCHTCGFEWDSCQCWNTLDLPYTVSEGKIFTFHLPAE